MTRRPVLVLSANKPDCTTLTSAALAEGCKAAATDSPAEARSLLQKEKPLLLFCDSILANGGGTLRSLSECRETEDPRIVLLVPHDITAGHLKGLKPWVQDYLAKPVLREAASARIRIALRLNHLERTLATTAAKMHVWLSGLESAIDTFEPMSFDRGRVRDVLARQVVRNHLENGSGPACFMVAVPDGKGSLSCDVYASSSSGFEHLGSGVTIPESAVFLRIKAENGSSHINYFEKGTLLQDFQASFPPGLLKLTGNIRNLAGLVHSGVYSVAFNYGRPVSADDALFLKGLAIPACFLNTVAATVHDVSESFQVAARALALATDSHGDNGAHVRRMNDYAKALAQQLALSDGFIRTISYSAQLHDVGKIYLHPDLLEKPVRLTAHEFDLVKKHPQLGAQMLGDSALLQVARNIALTHHECWDGTGYPSGLSGEAIPIEGAIIKIADVYDALRTMHTYKSAYSHEDACRFILRGGGDERHEIRPSHFNPETLKAFSQIAGKFEEIYHSAGQ